MAMGAWKNLSPVSTEKLRATFNRTLTRWGLDISERQRIFFFLALMKQFTLAFFLFTSVRELQERFLSRQPLKSIKWKNRYQNAHNIHRVSVIKTQPIPTTSVSSAQKISFPRLPAVLIHPSSKKLV
jgi:hypothetical protein